MLSFSKIFPQILMMSSFYSKNSWPFVYTSLTFHNTQVNTSFCKKKDLKSAFLPKYIICLHRNDCWCISFLYCCIKTNIQKDQIDDLPETLLMKASSACFHKFTTLIWRIKLLKKEYTNSLVNATFSSWKKLCQPNWVLTKLKVTCSYISI